MARNLRAKIPETDELFVCDRNTAAATSFLSEAPNAAVQVSRTPREVAERAVSVPAFHFYCYVMSHCSIDDLSWG